MQIVVEASIYVRCQQLLETITRFNILRQKEFVVTTNFSNLTWNSMYDNLIIAEMINIIIHEKFEEKLISIIFLSTSFSQLIPTYQHKKTNKKLHNSLNSVI